jgi:soluble lytic murein transglycosylase-like protein
MRVGTAMPHPFIRGQAASSLRLNESLAVARRGGQEPAPNLMRGRSQTGACALPLADASTMARWLRRGERIRFRPAALLLSGLILIGALCVADAGQAPQVGRAAPSDSYAAHIAEASRRFGIPATWIRAVMPIESGGDRRAVSRKRAMGLMQIMPQTWAELRVRYALGRNPFDPHDNILAGAAFLREMHDRYGSPGFLAAYNAGAARYEDYRDRRRALPPETVAYVAALVPLVGGDEIAGPVLMVASDPSPHSPASLFAVRTDAAPHANRPTSDLPSGDTRAMVPVRDLSAIVPQSDGLFVALSTTGRAP